MNYGVVLLASTRFGGQPPQTDWQLARAVARHRTVLYVDPPTFVHDAVRHRAWERLRPTITEESPGMHVLRPLASPGADRPQLAAAGDAVIGAQVRWAAQRVFGSRPRIMLCFDPFRGPLSVVPRDALVYHIQDRVPAVPDRQPEHVLRRHADLLRRADLVTAISDILAEEAAQVCGRTVVLPNGGEFNHFVAPAPPPPELPPGQVVIGYAGAVAPRVDFDLVTALADAEPDWLMVFVGETTVEVPTRPNIAVFGPRPYADMPAWVQRFDVGVIPLILSDHIRAAFPLKTYEYLAAGRPVVATDMPMLRPLHPFVRLAGDAASYIEAVRAAVTHGPGPNECRAVARDNSWEARGEQLLAEIDATMARRRVA